MEGKGAGSMRPVVWGGLAYAVGALGWLLLRWTGGGQGTVDGAFLSGLAALAGYGLGRASRRARRGRIERPVRPIERDRAEVIWVFRGRDGGEYSIVQLGEEMVLWKAAGGRLWVTEGAEEEVLWEVERMTSGIGQ
jgi:hypothetical protein